MNTTGRTFVCFVLLFQYTHAQEFSNRDEGTERQQSGYDDRYGRSTYHSSNAWTGVARATSSGKVLYGALETYYLRNLQVFPDLLHGEVLKQSTPAEGGLPTSDGLIQNFPNPFNPSTVIGFQTAEEGLVTIKVYDVMGREISTLVSGRLPAGRHSIQWIAGDVAAGVYFCRLQTTRFVDSKKILLIK